MGLISLVKAAPSESGVYAAIDKSLQYARFEFSRNIKRVAIKPNLCYYWDYSTGETTDSKFVSALIDLLRERISRDVEISVVESDASAMKCFQAFKMLNYEKMAKKKEIRLVNLSLDANEKVKVKTGSHSLTLGLPRTIKEAQLFINVPKIKYMPHTQISCALKNIYGCNPYAKKYRYHQYLDEVIVGLNHIMKSSLCLVDGIIVRGKYTRRLGLVMASSDIVATDSVAARIAGLNPRRIKHLVLAEKAGLGKISCATVGEDINYFAQRFPKEDARVKIKSTLIRLGIFSLRGIGRYPSS